MAAAADAPEASLADAAEAVAAPAGEAAVVDALPAEAEVAAVPVALVVAEGAPPDEEPAADALPGAAEVEAEPVGAPPVDARAVECWVASKADDHCVHCSDAHLPAAGSAARLGAACWAALPEVSHLDAHLVVRWVAHSAAR